MIKENATGFPGSPSIFGIILNRYGDYFKEIAKNLKFIVVNSAPLPPEMSKKIMKILPNTKLYVYYGLTEASRSTFILHSLKNKKLLKSVGKATPNTAIAILNENQEIKHNSAKGEVLIKGENVMYGYWNKNVDNNKIMIKNWFKTGDLGYIDKNGYLFLEGRKKDMINIGGLKTSSDEINKVYLKMESISDFHAFSYKIKNNFEVGEKIVAIICLSDSNVSIENLLEFGRLKLEEYKIPKEYYVHDRIPRSETGKPLLHEILKLIKSKKIKVLN
tara:strand:+ start:86 stop:910 length:825 start_codon:yes stop_codon:yes gene_type:complete